MIPDKILMDELCDTARLYNGSRQLRLKLYEVLDKHIPHLDEGCKERGCACYDDRLVSPEVTENNKMLMKGVCNWKGEKLPPKKDHGWFYRREEGMTFTPGLGFMWDHKSRGFLLQIGKVYLWVRYSIRSKKMFVRAGVHKTKEVKE